MCNRWFRMLLPLFLILILSLSGCRPEETPPAGDPNLPADSERLPVMEEIEVTNATVYYVTTDHQYLLPLNLTINATKEVAKVAMEKLLAGPPNAYVAGVIPADTKLLDLYSSNTTVYVNVTADILEVDPAQAQLALDSIRCTILPLVEGFKLQLLVEGKVLDELAEGVDISHPRSLPYVNVRPADQEKAQQNTASYTPLTYYVGDSQAMYLVPQTLLYAPPEQEEPPLSGEALAEDQARAVVAALLADQPEDSGLFSPFWQGTELLNLYVEDGVAYVDFSAALLEYGGGSTFEVMMVSCLTQSLSRISGISAVQLLVEGRANASLPEGLDVSKPLTPIQVLNEVK